MAAYREDKCNVSDLDANGFYFERGNQQPNYSDDASKFDFTATNTTEDFAPPQNDAPGVSISQLCNVAPYVFEFSKD